MLLVSLHGFVSCCHITFGFRKPDHYLWLFTTSINISIIYTLHLYLYYFFKIADFEIKYKSNIPQKKHPHLIEIPLTTNYILETDSKFWIHIHADYRPFYSLNENIILYFAHAKLQLYCTIDIIFISQTCNFSWDAQIFSIHSLNLASKTEDDQIYICISSDKN